MVTDKDGPLEISIVIELMVLRMKPGISTWNLDVPAA